MEEINMDNEKEKDLDGTAVSRTLELIREMTKKYELRTLSSKADAVRDEIGTFSLRVLAVGAFSAGKSALMNAVIGEDLLEENQRPETAIASELVYDTDEYIEALSDGRKDRYSLDEAENIRIQDYDYLIWHLNRGGLKHDKDCVLVDMPGFNSGISAHNKAILKYAGKGNAYLLVIDCEEGTVRQNLAEFIQEIKNYDDNLAIVVTKTDLKTDETAAQVRDEIEMEASMYFGSSVPVVATSKYDEQAGEKVWMLADGFDRERIFFQQYAPQVYELGIQCLDSMETYKKSLRLDVSQFDQEIERHEKSKEQLAKQLQREQSKLESRFRDTVAPAISADMQNALYANTDQLANSLQAGGQSFSASVNNILRPVLLSSTQQNVDVSFSKFLSEIDLPAADFDESIQAASSQALGAFQKANDSLQKLSQDSGKYNALYKTITTTLAVATSAVAPWLELIIIFLPDILKVFTKGRQESALRDKVSGQIIPQIVEYIRPEIEKSLDQMKDEMIQGAQEQIGSFIDSEVESLEAAKEKKAAETEAFQKAAADVQQDIDRLHGALECM